MKKLFVTGIGTDVGKTVVAAVLTEALQADYWKPVQAGDLDNTDTMKVKRLISNKKSRFQNSFCLNWRVAKRPIWMSLFSILFIYCYSALSLDS